jgi:hypothetical protein
MGIGCCKMGGLHLNRTIGALRNKFSLKKNVYFPLYFFEYSTLYAFDLY